jgi:hypothetical protein
MIRLKSLLKIRKFIGMLLFRTSLSDLRLFYLLFGLPKATHVKVSDIALANQAGHAASRKAGAIQQPNVAVNKGSLRSGTGDTGLPRSSN